MSTGAPRQRELYPNPQFARANWHDLCGQWGFAHDDADAGRDAGWFRDGPFDRQITVPFPPESEASGCRRRR